MASPREEAIRLLEHLPDEATWDDIMYKMYVKKKIARGLEAANADDVISQDELEQELLGE